VILGRKARHHFHAFYPAKVLESEKKTHFCWQSAVSRLIPNKTHTPMASPGSGTATTARDFAALADHKNRYFPGGKKTPRLHNPVFPVRKHAHSWRRWDPAGRRSHRSQDFSAQIIKFGASGAPAPAQGAATVEFHSAVHLHCRWRFPSRSPRLQKTAMDCIHVECGGWIRPQLMNAASARPLAPLSCGKKRPRLLYFRKQIN